MTDLVFLENITSNMESIELDNGLNAELKPILDQFNIRSINDLNYDMFLELTTSQIKKHTNTTRGGLFARRVGRYTGVNAAGIGIGASLGLAATQGIISKGAALALATPAGAILGILFTLIEGGIIPTTEKFAFIRFQGLSDLHAKRLDERLQTIKYTDLINKSKKEIMQLPMDVSPNKAQDLYSDMISTEAAIIVSGYIKLMVHSGEDEDKIKVIKDDFLKLKTSFAKGSGVWNRVKSHFGGSIVSTLLPAFSFISHFQNLDKKAPNLHLIQNTQKKLSRIIK